MKRVEVRLLQLVLSHVSGDRVTLGLLHWDGVALRVAASMAPLAALDAPHRDTVRATARAWMRRARRAAAGMATQGTLGFGLSQVFPVREGMGAALLWTKVSAFDVVAVGAHFEQLARELHLDRVPRHESRRRLTPRMLNEDLVELGERLKEELGGELVLVGNLVRSRQPYTAPLSWKNGAWHHAIGLTLEGLDSAQIQREVQRIHGLIDLAIPPGDVPVVVAPGATGAPCEAVDDAKALVSDKLRSRGGELIAPPMNRLHVQLDYLASRVREDVRHALPPAE